jgi:hypothetical protein
MRSPAPAKPSSEEVNVGADLLGFLVKGPVKITRQQIETAAKAMLVTARERQRTGLIYCPDCGCEIDVNKGFDGRCPGCCQQIGDPLIDIHTLKDARAHVKRLAEGWPPECRDTASRHDPDDARQILVFAGDTSNGDEPAGAGYQYLKELMQSGCAEALGVR